MSLIHLSKLEGRREVPFMAPSEPSSSRTACRKAATDIKIFAQPCYPLSKRIMEYHTCPAKIIDVAGYHCQVVNQRNRCNLFVYWMLMVW